jgi:hypothetical protein
MKLSEAQALAEQAIYDYTSSTKWQQVKYMNWTTSEMQDVIAKALVNNINYTRCSEQLKDNRTLSFMDWIDFNKYTTSNIGYVDKERKSISLDELWEKWHEYKENL